MYGTLHIIKQFELFGCGHKKRAIEPRRCLLECVEKQSGQNFLIATQDAELSERIRELANTPLLYFNRHAVTLDKPSEAAAAVPESEDESDAAQLERLRELKRQTIADVPRRNRPKRRAPGGPNPLSCKKSKKIAETSAAAAPGKRVRKRKRMRVAAHVKDALEEVAE